MRIIDLTQTIHEAMPVFPGTAAPVLSAANTIADSGFKETMLHMVSHTGTHMDAPAHMLPQAKNLDDYPVEQFCGTALLLDCRACREYIERAFLEPYHEKIARADFVLLHTGHSAHWNSAAYFDGFAIPTPEAAAYLASFPLKGVGVDAISFDAVSDYAQPAHHALLGRGLVLIENLCQLEQIESTYCWFSALPLKYRGADGSPVRAIAAVLA